MARWSAENVLNIAYTLADIDLLSLGGTALLRLYVNILIWFSKLGACQQLSTVDYTLMMDKYLKQARYKQYFLRENLRNKAVWKESMFS